MLHSLTLLRGVFLFLMRTGKAHGLRNGLFLKLKKSVKVLNIWEQLTYGIEIKCVSVSVLTVRNLSASISDTTIERQI